MVQLDLNGDGVGAMEIFLQGLGGQSLSSGDFLFNSSAGAPANFVDVQQSDTFNFLALSSTVTGGGVYTDAMAFARFDPGSGQFVDETHGNDRADFAIGHLIIENHIPTGSEFML